MSEAKATSTYGYVVGGIFIFNLVLGTGCLALPYGWNYGGLAAGVVLTVLIFCFAYICATFVVEALSHSFAISRSKEFKNINNNNSINYNNDNDGDNDNDNNDHHHKNNDYQVSPSLPMINEDPSDSQTPEFGISLIELGTMSEIYLGAAGRWTFYLILIAYLYGDLAIYAVAVPQSVVTTVASNGITIADIVIGKDVCYWICLTIYALIVGPFCFFNFANTKYLQYFTIMCRNIAMFLMITIGLGYIFQGKGANPDELTYFNPSGLATLWGTILYCFMCHHSIPGMISPLKDKKKVNVVIFVVYVVLLIVFSLLAGSGVFAFGTETNTSCTNGPCELQSIYTENFLFFQIKIVGYLLGLYPVFTISTNFPLIGITLRNNILHIIKYGENTKFQKFRRPVAALITIIPPLLVAAVFTDVSALVSITGSYAGLGIEFIIPSVLVYYSRKEMRYNFGEVNENNPYKSPFQHIGWIILILLTAAISLVIVTLNNVYSVIQLFKDN